MREKLRVVEVTEWKEILFPASEISEGAGSDLWRAHKDHLDVEFPSPKTKQQWALRSLGWVGYIPVSETLGLRLQPKVPLGNLFRMLEYAYQLESFSFSQGLIDADSLAEFYERLANVFAKRILDRARRGLYRAYVPESDDLPYLRGTMDMRRRFRRPWSVRLNCDYHEHTADIEENQILLWTLARIARSGSCSERVLPTVRRAYRALQGAAQLTPFSPIQCIRRLYNRLNGDYQPLHALCRFFLEHTGPTHEQGNKRSLPFLVNMSRLYELFLAQWLKRHLPGDLRLQYQEQVSVGQADQLSFKIDMVVYKQHAGLPLAIMDAKYKDVDDPSTEDFSQVVTYAKIKGAKLAILVYPKELSRHFHASFAGLDVRTLAFDLAGDLETSGQAFLSQLIGCFRA